MALTKRQYDDCADAIKMAKITSMECRHVYARAAGDLSACQVQRALLAIFSSDKKFNAQRFIDRCMVGDETPPKDAA